MFCFYIHCTALFYAIWPYGHKDEIKVYFTQFLERRDMKLVSATVLNVHLRESGVGEA